MAKIPLPVGRQTDTVKLVPKVFYGRCFIAQGLNARPASFFVPNNLSKHSLPSSVHICELAVSMIKEKIFSFCRSYQGTMPATFLFFCFFLDLGLSEEDLDLLGE